MASVQSRPMRGLDLRGTVVDVGSGEVDLVQHGHDLQVVVQREEHVGDGLRLDALRGVDDEQRALARGQRARDLVLEVDVAGRVDEVEHVPLAVLRVYFMRAACSLIVMPRSRSMSILSRS